jgi:hypothetical protein
LAGTQDDRAAFGSGAGRGHHLLLRRVDEVKPKRVVEVSRVTTRKVALQMKVLDLRMRFVRRSSRWNRALPSKD